MSPENEENEYQDGRGGRYGPEGSSLHWKRGAVVNWYWLISLH